MVDHHARLWQCAAIDHGLAIFPNGKIGPCCQISADYLKPAALISDPTRFQDLHTEYAPPACEKCVRNEHDGVPSYRQFFNSQKTRVTKDIAFLDIRNTNQCNLKCRYCGPHFSNQWAKELEQPITLRETDLESWYDLLLTENLQVIYFTGGEPMISRHHWQILQQLVDKEVSADIALLYTTNLTQLRYKQIDILDLWQRFKSINIAVSIDAIDNVFENIRSGASWQDIDSNLRSLLLHNSAGKIKVSVSCVVSILNIWHLESLLCYCKELALPINFILLDGPDYLALDVIPDQLQSQAIDVIDRCQVICPDAALKQARHRIINNRNQVLFKQCLSHVLLLDNIRKEKLFDLLPFRKLAQELVTDNKEYASPN